MLRDPIVNHIGDMTIVDPLGKCGRGTKPSRSPRRPSLNCCGVSQSVHMSDIKRSTDQICENSSVFHSLTKNDAAIEWRRKDMMVDDTKREILQR